MNWEAVHYIPIIPVAVGVINLVVAAFISGDQNAYFFAIANFLLAIWLTLWLRNIERLARRNK